MKRTLLNITEKMSRNIGHTTLTPKDLNHPYYWIFEAKGWKLQDVLREVQIRETQDRIKIYLNTQHISTSDCIIENGDSGLVIKFIKARFEFYTKNQVELDFNDYIEIKGDIEQYA
jgi:hypothetical protein